VSGGWKNNLVMGVAKRSELNAEFLGTFVLILGGVSVVATAIRRDIDYQAGLTMPVGQIVVVDQHSKGVAINLGWAVSVAMGVLVSFDASGAHLNPAVTFSAMVHDSFGVTKGFLFMIFQVLGAFFGALLAMIMFTALSDEEYGLEANNGFYHTGPSANTSMANAFLVEIVATAMLLIFIKFAVTGKGPAPNKFIMAGCLFFFIVFIGFTMGYQTGYSLNPARELCPRFVRFLWQASQGRGTSATFDNFDWLAPVFGPLIGAPLGVLVWKWGSAEEEESSAAPEGVEKSSDAPAVVEMP